MGEWPIDGLCEAKDCDNAAVVGLQQKYYCMTHYEEAMAVLGDFLRKLTGA